MRVWVDLLVDILRRVCGVASADVGWFAFEPFTLFDDGWCNAEVGIGGGHVVETLVVTLVIVVLDERLDLRLQIA